MRLLYLFFGLLIVGILLPIIVPRPAEYTLWFGALMLSILCVLPALPFILRGFSPRFAAWLDDK
jgi:hypothetical protein